MNYINALTSIPVSDGNFQYALTKYATIAEIEEAIHIMENRNGTDKSRIAACKREMRRREKNG
jgi:hypothetical protein